MAPIGAIAILSSPGICGDDHRWPAEYRRHLVQGAMLRFEQIALPILNRYELRLGKFRENPILADQTTSP